MSAVNPKTIALDVGAGATAFSILRSEAESAIGDDPFAGFNVCHYTGDSQQHIAACRRELAQMLGVGVEVLVIPRQTHSVNVAVIGEDYAAQSADVHGLDSVDALVTCREDVALVVNTADCLPVVFNDNLHGVIGIAHAGWRGLYDGILEKTVEAMEGIGAVRSEIRVAIGPCICADCYEVDEDFAERFVRKYGESVRLYREIVRIAPPGDKPPCGLETLSQRLNQCNQLAEEDTNPRGQNQGKQLVGEDSNHQGQNKGKPHVNLRAAAVVALSRAGIDGDRVAVTPICTRCDKRFFSARRMGIASGRMATVVRKVGIRN